MKKLVWSETRVQGGTPFSGTLAKPPTVSGPFQNVPFVQLGRCHERPDRQAAARVLQGQRRRRLSRAVERRSVGLAEAHHHLERRHDRCVAAVGRRLREVQLRLPKAPVGEKAWIQIDFAQPQAIRSVSLALAGFVFPFGPPPPGPDLEASDDGQSFRKVVNIPRSTAKQNTVSFAPVRARFFRVTFLTRRRLRLDSVTSTFPFRRRPRSTRSRSWCCTPARA